MSIKNLAEDDRPREKFLLKGRNSLSDSELLAIIMGSGNRNESAVELARKILNSVENNWNRLSQLSVNDLMKFKGIGEAKAISIATALEIGRRRIQQEMPENVQITSSEAVYKLMHPLLSDLQTEEFWAIFLNQSNNVLRKERLSMGGINNSSVDLRILFKSAFENYSTGIILVHNHPSGKSNPSKVDIQITEKILNAGKMLDVILVDHLIVARNSYFSFADEQMI